MIRSNGKLTAAKIAALIEEGRVTGPTAIAETLGISRATVHRHLAHIRPALDELAEQRKAYRLQVEANSPAEHRAKRIRGLIDQDTQPMVALKALQYADSVTGVGPVNESSEQAPPAPAFVLPPGTTMRMVAQVDTRSDTPRPADTIDSET